MRSYISHRCLTCLFLLPALMLFVSGCGDQPLPDAPYAGASRELMENPAAAAAKLKGVEEEKAKSKSSAKAEAARAKAATADPRGK